jgi:hypothetical protein
MEQVTQANRLTRRVLKQDAVVYDIEVRKLNFVKRLGIGLKIILGESVLLRLSEEGLQFKVEGSQCDGILL